MFQSSPPKIVWSFWKHGGPHTAKVNGLSDAQAAREGVPPMVCIDPLIGWHGEATALGDHTGNK